MMGPPSFVIFSGSVRHIVSRKNILTGLRLGVHFFVIVWESVNASLQQVRNHLPNEQRTFPIQVYTRHDLFVGYPCEMCWPKQIHDTGNEKSFSISA